MKQRKKQTEWNRAVQIGLVGAALSLFGIYLVAAGDFSGSLPPQLLLAGAAVSCVIIAARLSPSAFMLSITGFLIAGFWVKFIYHESFTIPYLEPTGSFGSSTAEWDRALLAAAAGLFGVASAGALWAGFTPRTAIPEAEFANGTGYRKIEVPLAILSLFVSIALFAANWRYGFVRIGIEPQVVLPGPLHAIVSFLIQWGIALWAGCMLYWAWSAGRLPMWAVLLAGLVEGCIAGISNLSRGRYIFHTLAFALAWFGIRKNVRSQLGIASVLGLAAAAAILFAVSILAVQYDRAIAYHASPETITVQAVEAETPSPAHSTRESTTDLQLSGAATDSTSDSYNLSETIPSATQTIAPDPVDPIIVNAYFSQISQLFIDRWIGIEATMAVAAFPERGWDLFVAGIFESSDARNDGLFEKISGSSYQAQEQLTFTTTAGFLAILFYSGSYVVVFFGMLCVTLAGLALERMSLQLTVSPFATAVVGVATANAICQVNQPYLSVVLAIELLLTCVFVRVFRLLFSGQARQSIQA